MAQDTTVKDLTPEEYRALQSQHAPDSHHHGAARAYIIVGLICVIAGFALGITYQKGKQSSSSNSISKQNSYQADGSGFGGRQFSGQRASFGQVTTVSSSSLTINNPQTGSSETFSITSSTTITDNGQSTTLSDIATGDTVAIIPDTTNTNQADRIMVNPSFGGDGAQSQSQSTGTSAPMSSSTSTTTSGV